MAKILIADDDPTIIHLLSVNLEMEGYQVVVAQDGLQAITKATKDPPDLIILDIMMPNMDGWATRDELLKSPTLADIPVIFLSARAQQADLRRGLEAGAAEYITKPFDPVDLLKIIEEVLAGTYKRQDSE